MKAREPESSIKTTEIPELLHWQDTVGDFCAAPASQAEQIEVVAVAGAEREPSAFR